jgi:hypothetical protein
VLGADGKLVSQDDNPPEGRSTLTFRAGEGIKQPHRIVLPNGAPAGTYHLYAGIYNRADIERWQATQNGAPAKDNLVRLGSFVLEDAQKIKIYLPVVARPNPPEPFQPPKAYPTP